MKYGLCVDMLPANRPIPPCDFDARLWWTSIHPNFRTAPNNRRTTGRLACANAAGTAGAAGGGGASAGAGTVRGSWEAPELDEAEENSDEERASAAAPRAAPGAAASNWLDEEVENLWLSLELGDDDAPRWANAGRVGGGRLTGLRRARARSTAEAMRPPKSKASLSFTDDCLIDIQKKNKL